MAVLGGAATVHESEGERKSGGEAQVGEGGERPAGEKARRRCGGEMGGRRLKECVISGAHLLARGKEKGSEVDQAWERMVVYWENGPSGGKEKEMQEGSWGSWKENKRKERKPG